MVRIPYANLTLTTRDTNTTIEVLYDVEFNAFERRMHNFGLRFFDIVEVWGIDPPGSRKGRILLTLEPMELGGITNPEAGDLGSQTIHYLHTQTVSRSSLQEDTVAVATPSDDINDEIRCKIRVVPYDMPTEVSAWTDQEILLG